jgi:hypothetical protein
MALQARGHGIETGNIARPESLARREEVSLVVCQGCIAECGKHGSREKNNCKKEAFHRRYSKTWRPEKIAHNAHHRPSDRGSGPARIWKKHAAQPLNKLKTDN